ncbi:amidohydrolase [Arthrobacter sp. AQ5-05]|uniref:amidohydrolase n=1 Tax=Arthrobacter sp. AQ5-05 TaxID=2184581 RepID=UPI000DCBA082|nr:amidohydrolase [Arthrobacter sp. AQ5-05]RAX49524.1 amidohydrolase [Arthrobacter sp. AQ5-05]
MSVATLRLLDLDSSTVADLAATYKHLHANPELSMQEHQTARYLEGRLGALGLETIRCGGTGVIGILRNGDGPVVGYRADTDGLPVQENTGLDYASTVTAALPDGTEVPVMHACGHDVHMAVALSSASVLAGNRDEWAGTVVFILQPGEETAAGAKAMVDDGLWDKAPKPEIIYGAHVIGALAGTVTVAPAAAMAMADSLKVTVLGKGSHGSMPEHSIDPIVLGASMVVRLQTIVSREVAPRSAAVVTVGTFHAGLKENIIADRAEFTLNVRTFDPAVRNLVLAAIRRIVTAEAAASAAPEPIVEQLYRFPALVNDPAETHQLISELREVLGDQNVIVGKPVMGSEDFGHLATAIGVPNVYWRFGSNSDETLAKGTPPANHSPFFAPSIEPTLQTGVRAAITAILSKLGN